MLKAIALDDEIPALEVIEAFAGRTDLIELQATFSRTGQARRFLEEHPVDLLFLDIQMPAISGIDFSRSIPKDVIVIFTTSYAEYAVESYNLNAVDYLLKPFTYQRFLQALDKACELYEARFAPAEQPPIILRANYGLVKVRPNDILFIEGLDNYLKIHLIDKELLVVRLTLREMMEKLSDQKFMRVHRSYIVPFDQIQQVRNKHIYIGEQEIPLGGTYEEEFNRRFNSDTN